MVVYYTIRNNSILIHFTTRWYPAVALVYKPSCVLLTCSPSTNSRIVCCLPYVDMFRKNLNSIDDILHYCMGTGYWYENHWHIRFCRASLRTMFSYLPDDKLTDLAWTTVARLPKWPKCCDANELVVLKWIQLTNTNQIKPAFCLIKSYYVNR